MNIEILPLDRSRLGDVQQADRSFEVQGRLKIALEEGVFSYTIAPVEPFTKNYPPDDLDPADYLDNPDRAIFLACVEGRLAGEIILRKNWNGFGYIENIAVERPFRRQGTGRRLLEAAACWARERGLPGLMLETQDINVGACRLYEQCGFILGGVDHLLYRGLDQPLDEIALFWYRLFQ